MNKSLMVVILSLMSLIAGPALAANAMCEKSAVDKKLAGAAKTAHIKKCEREAAEAAAPASAVCEKSAADKKLAGAAKTSHLRKCMADAAPK